ncbi:MAG: PQQ-binding-like beta-propeller repeat protein [Olegusella sp.]|nr:PQQ-binding-like beta-propeller repeat protein [Olegusella sp.]
MKHRMSAWRKLAAAALSALLALNLAYPAVPAFAEEGDPAPAAEEQEPQSTNIKAQSDEAENTDSTPVEKISVSVAVIGPDTDGNDVYWLQPTYVTVNKGDFAWAAVKPALDGSGLTWSWSDGSWGISFNSITSPFTSATLGWDAATGKYWQLFINDTVSQLGVSSAGISDGDRIVYYYSTYGAATATNPSSATYDEPNAGMADLPSDWSQSEDNGNVTSATTPTTETSVNWKTRISGSNGAPVSEPLIVDGKVYLAIGENPSWASIKSDYAGKLVRIDTASGKVEATGDLAGAIDYTVRPLYQGGIIYVPLSNGVVQAFNASTMKTRWVSESRTKGEQSSCSLRIENGALYVGTAISSYPNYPSGSISALDAATGRTLWSKANSAAGYIWTAPVCVNGLLCIGDTSGAVHVFDPATGAEQGTFSLGSPIKSDPVLYRGHLLVVTNDGVLHQLAVQSDGSLKQLSTASTFAKGYVTAAPTVVGSTAVIAGSDNYQGAIAIVDLLSMTTQRTVTTATGTAFGQGNFAGSPLASIQKDGTWLYFALNSAAGALYSYRLGDAEAHLLYAPDGTVAQYCDSPVIADAKGNLYYLNDSGYLVQLKAGEVKKDNSKPSSSTDTNSKPTSGNTAAVPTAKPNAASAATHQGGRPVTSHVVGNSASSTNKPAETQQGSTAESATEETTTEPSATDDAATTETAPETETARQIPIWPIIGILVGAILLIWLFASRCRKDEESK